MIEFPTETRYNESRNGGMDMELTEKTVRREELLNGRVLKMHIDDVELPDGSRASR